jgi:hypothetical protein
VKELPMKRVLAVVLSGLVMVGCESGCASAGGPRHVAQLSSSGSGAVLDMIQDSELRIVCGRAGAPQPPLCVSDEDGADGTPSLHRQIHAKLAQAYGLHGTMTELIKATPDGVPQPAEILVLVARMSALVNEALALMPDSQQKANVVQQLRVQ